ncbi:MAG TPA: diacylglycerol kinase family protein [Chloroflexota bacterium]|nr:diacylglycerol kinase family protein [Chloroflexota bacterium]
MKARIVYNPLSGGARGEQELEEVERYLQSLGWEVDRRCSSHDLSPTDLARDGVRDGCEAIIAAGGDGTINQVIQALAGTDVALGAIPRGTGNAWARQVALPWNNPKAAARVLGECETRRIDLGRADGRYFLLMAGVGFDAEVTRQLDRRLKKRYGILAYWIVGVRLAFKWRGVPVTLEFDGQRRRGRALMMVVSNCRLYGGTARIAYRALIDDGLLDVTLLRGSSFLDSVAHLFRVMLGGRVPNPEMEYYRVQRIGIGSSHRLAVQIDGDPAGETPMTFTIAPGALKVLIPRDAPRDIFVDSAKEPTPISPTVVLQQLREVTRNWFREWRRDREG